MKLSLLLEGQSLNWTGLSAGTGKGQAPGGTAGERLQVRSLPGGRPASAVSARVLEGAGKKGMAQAVGEQRGAGETFELGATVKD